MISEVIKLYADREDVTLTTYILHNSTEFQTNMKKPAVLICPGGAYLSCSDREAEPIALAFASMGYQTFVLRYSTYGGEAFAMMGTGKELPEKPEVNYPTQMREIGMAMAKIKEHAEEWHVDANRVAICGFSAGAHNCAMYSVYWDKPVIVDYIGKGKELLRPAACILGYTLSDYVFMKASGLTGMDKDFFDVSNYAFLGTKDPSDALLKEVSPAFLVDDQTPPTYLWATAGDNLVPVQHSLLYAHALADQGIPFEMHIFEEGDHGLALAAQATATSQKECRPDAAKWVGLCDAWLKKRFSFELPEKSPYETMIAEGVSF